MKKTNFSTENGTSLISKGRWNRTIPFAIWVYWGRVIEATCETSLDLIKSRFTARSSILKPRTVPELISNSRSTGDLFQY